MIYGDSHRDESRAQSFSVEELTYLLNSRPQRDGGKNKEGDPLREAGRATARDFAGFVVYFRHCRDFVVAVQ